MADDVATTVTFRVNHLVRLHGLKNQVALNGTLVRIVSDFKEATKKFEVVLLDDRARPPVPAVPARRMAVKPEHFNHACECCLVVAPEGERLQICGRCKTARYCNNECFHSDWARHESPDCLIFGNFRALDTPLQQACMDGDVAEVRRLVEVEGADVDKATSNGPTPLTTATRSGHFSVVRYLVEQGADVNKARATNITPLCVAATLSLLPILRYLVEHGADMDKLSNAGAPALQHAVMGGHLAAVRYLVEQGADKDKTDCDGATAVYLAAACGHLAVVRYLVEQGADMDKPDENGCTPLQAALMQGHGEVAAYLRAAGAT